MRNAFKSLYWEIVMRWNEFKARRCFAAAAKAQNHINVLKRFSAQAKKALKQ